jgi:hypothetical protein
MISENAELIRTGFWKSVRGTGLERFELLQTPYEWKLKGTILEFAKHGPAEARYEVVCDAGWRTKSAEILLRDDGIENTVRIIAKDGLWYENGQPNESVAGCIDIDLGWSPSTNTLPIRRLRLDVGQSSGNITAAWVSFPDLQLRPLPQEYLRISDCRYRYSSRGGAFVAEISVDEDGLVVDYEGFWQRVSRPV